MLTRDDCCVCCCPPPPQRLIIPNTRWFGMDRMTWPPSLLYCFQIYTSIIVFLMVTGGSADTESYCWSCCSNCCCAGDWWLCIGLTHDISLSKYIASTSTRSRTSFDMGCHIACMLGYCGDCAKRKSHAIIVGVIVWRIIIHIRSEIRCRNWRKWRRQVAGGGSAAN